MDVIKVQVNSQSLRDYMYNVERYLPFILSYDVTVC
jgi:hypothetical protein